MKAGRELHFPDTQEPEQAKRHVVRVRLAECLELQHALGEPDDDALHAFRLACKRLRYALERDRTRAQAFAPALAALTRLTDELGWAHDCVELIGYAQRYAAPIVALRAARDRNRYAARAKRLWRHALRADGALAQLVTYAGFPAASTEPASPRRPGRRP